MKIKNIISSKVITINQNATYKEAAFILYQNKISGAPVVDDGGNLVGMLSEKDLFKCLYPYEKSYSAHPDQYLDFENRENKTNEIENHKVNTFMTKEVITISGDTPVLKAGGLMLAKGIHRLPVMEDNKLIGIVSRDDIFGRVFKN